MTPHLTKIMNDLNRFSDVEQNSIASLIRKEILWEASLKKSSKKLSKLAQEALKEHCEGKTKSLIFPVK